MFPIVSANSRRPCGWATGTAELDDGYLALRGTTDLVNSIILPARVSGRPGMLRPRTATSSRPPCRSTTARATPALESSKRMSGRCRRASLCDDQYAGVLGPHNLANSSIFGGLSDCHYYSAWGYAECTGTFPGTFPPGAGQNAQLHRRHEYDDHYRQVLPEYDDFKYWAMSDGSWASTHAPLNWMPGVNQPWNDWFDQMGFRSRHPTGPISPGPTAMSVSSTKPSTP